MKNQPNKATVKDGLPTAEQIIRTKIKEHSASTVNIDVDNIPAFTHFLFVAIEAMQSYSDQQNAELRGKLKELEAKIASYESAIDGLKKVVDSLYNLKS